MKNGQNKNKPEKKKSFLRQFFGIKSILLMAGGFLLVAIAFKAIPSYDWVVNQMLKGNYEIAKKYPKATYDQRMEMKLQFTYVYYNYIKQNTPEDAVILFPDRELLIEKKIPNQSIGDNMAGKSEITYFLYPRQILYQSEKENPLYNEVTHIAIANGYGYENLDYQVENRPAFGIFPKKK